MRVTASWLTRIRLPFWKMRFNTSSWLSPFSVKAQISQSRVFSVGSAHLCCPSVKNAQSQIDEQVSAFMLNLTHHFGVSSVMKNYSFSLQQLFKNVKTILRSSASQKLEGDEIGLHVIISLPTLMN